MSFDEVLESRRSIRKFLPDKVSDSDIKKIIEAGILAPSAYNAQPWKIMVLNDEQRKGTCDALMKKKDMNPSIEMTAKIIEESPVLIAIFYEKTKDHRDNDILSIGAFIENMHLKATELNLGSLWIANTNHIKEELKEITNTNLECVSYLAIGYKGQEPKKRPRKSLEEIIIE